MRNHLSIYVAAALLSLPAAAVSPEAALLRNRGLAELENEKPELAEKAYRQLIEVAPKDPLGFGNLAIAELRQQKNEAAMASIERALEISPGRADLLAIKSEVLQWTGDLDGALTLMKQAADAAPEDLELLYAAYSLAGTLRTEAAEAAGIEVLRRLARLRPENLVVLLQLGQKAIAAGDRGVASGVFIRVEQLLWQVDQVAERALGMVTAALESGDVAEARVPAIRLENVLKVSAMYRESLRELKTGIQGIPIRRFVDEPEIEAFGDPLAIELAGTRLDERPTAGRALAAGDFDGDGKPDLARIRDDGGEGGGTLENRLATLEVRLAAGGWKVSGEHPAPGTGELLAADLDNDGHLDLTAFGRSQGAVWLGAGDGSFTAAPEALGLGQAGAAAAAVIDFDIEGDLDLALAGGASGPADLYRNSLEGPLERVGAKSLPRLPDFDARSLAASDLDRDGDLDLVIAHARGLTWVDNLRQGRFVDASAGAGLVPSAALEAVVSADLDNDGLPDLIGGGDGITAWHNRPGAGNDRGGRFEAWVLAGLPPDARIAALHAFDADNDGRLDLAAAAADGLHVLTQQGGAAGVSFATAAISGGPASTSAVVSADLDLDGDLDLAAAGPEGLHWFENRGGNQNHWLVVRLRGLAKGNSKNNFHGVGSVVEVSAGRAYQFREAAGDAVHLGIGSQKAADVLRVVWTNGVPQNRLQVEGGQRLVEEQLLKGSCPFLYAWDGSKMAFVTDLLWGAPLGLPVAAGAWASSDPRELVLLPAALTPDGSYRLRITEELWEAAYFDYVRLWVVDHPAEVEVASSLKIVPGKALPVAPGGRQSNKRVLASRDLRPVAAAWDGQGLDVTAAVQHRDDVYAAGYVKGRYQGASQPWTFTFDLGEAPGTPVRLHLDGWIFPADASLNLAVAQRRDQPYLPPRLEVETAAGWRSLDAGMGHPAGKTKTMVVDTPPLPAGARKLRIVTSLWLHWDRIAWTTAAADGEPIVRARLAPAVAEARYRGFSAMVRAAPNAPHAFDYQAVTAESPWLPFPGRYSRYGDVRELLAASDDLSVILAPGDEIALSFDAGDLAPPPAGYRRTVFLESHGWDKDADRNTWEAEQLEPLPFHAMSGYPFGPDESYPDTPAHESYRREWLTRELR